MTNSVEKEFKLFFEKLADSLSYLLLSRYFFQEFMKIVDGNPGLPNNNHFIIWIWNNYLDGASMHVRRLVDHSPQTHSFFNFLNKVKNYPILFSRERYVSEFTKNSGFTEKEAHHFFNETFGKSFNQISKREANREITAIDRKYEPLQKYVNTRIAHSSYQDLEKLPRIEDLHSCMDYLEGVFKKYYLLHHAGSYPTLLPTMQYPWTKIFKIPWIQTSKKKRIN